MLRSKLLFTLTEFGVWCLLNEKEQSLIKKSKAYQCLQFGVTEICDEHLVELYL